MPIAYWDLPATLGLRIDGPVRFRILSGALPGTHRDSVSCAVQLHMPLCAVIVSLVAFTIA